MTDIIFVEDNFDIEKINLNQIDLEQSKIFTLNFNAHIILKEKNIQHDIAESYISKNDRMKIFDASVKFRDWHKLHPNLDKLLFKGINIIEVFDLNELQQLFLERLFKLLIIKRILEKYKPEKILASESLKHIIESVSFISKSIIEIFPKPTANSSYFDKYQVDYKIGSLPISFQIKRTRLTKIKKWYEKIVAIQNFWYDENKVTNGVLFLEFDPTRYEELFNQLKKLGINIILLNTRKSAVWNSKSISIVKKYNCKLINEHQILANKKDEISKNLSHFESEFNKFWSDIDFLEKTFVFEQCVFWNVMKDPLIQVYKNRLEEFIKLILLSDKILKNSNFRCIVSLYTTGQTENAILKMNNNKISNILLGHGYANFVDDVSRFDIFHMYDRFKDKIAVWGKIEKEYIKNSRKVDEKRIFQVGSPRHDIFFDIKKETKKHNKKQVLILPSPIVNYSGLTDTETFLRYEKLIKKIIQILHKFETDIIVKLHPTQDPSNQFIKEIFKQNDKTIPIFHTTPILEQLKTADAVIHIEPHGIGLSTVILESLIMNIPTMNIVIKNEIFQFDCIKEKAILSHLDSDDIEKPISELLFNENVKNDLIKNTKNHLSNSLVNPGIASKKFAEILNSLN